MSKFDILKIYSSVTKWKPLDSWVLLNLHFLKNVLSSEYISIVHYTFSWILKHRANSLTQYPQWYTDQWSLFNKSLLICVVTSKRQWTFFRNQRKNGSRKRWSVYDCGYFISSVHTGPEWVCFVQKLFFSFFVQQMLWKSWF